jgi:hypothetical protein
LKKVSLSKLSNVLLLIITLSLLGIIELLSDLISINDEKLFSSTYSDKFILTSLLFLEFCFLSSSVLYCKA